MANEGLRKTPDIVEATLPLEEVPLELGRALGDLVAALHLTKADLTIDADDETNRLVVSGSPTNWMFSSGP